MAFTRADGSIQYVVSFSNIGEWIDDSILQSIHETRHHQKQYFTLVHKHTYINIITKLLTIHITFMCAYIDIYKYNNYHSFYYFIIYIYIYDMKKG